MPTLSDTQIVRTLRPIKRSSIVWPWSTLSLSLSALCKSHLPLIRIFGIILYLHEIPLAETIGVKKKKRFTWVAFIAQAAVVGHSLSQSNNLITEGGVAVYWGQSAFLVLGSAVIHFGWGYEAVRWRTALM